MASSLSETCNNCRFYSRSNDQCKEPITDHPFPHVIDYKGCELFEAHVNRNQKTLFSTPDYIGVALSLTVTPLSVYLISQL